MHKVLQQLSPDKVVAIQFILASSVNFDDMFDSIHSPEGVDHLTAERIMYVKSQEVENFAEDKSYKNSSRINSQNDLNYINHVISGPIDSVKEEKDTCLSKDTQENFDYIEEIDVLIEFIERMKDSYFIENPVNMYMK